MECKNYTIELWRFIFTMFVVMMHLSSSTVLHSDIFSMGGHSVEFFFILSGFLLYKDFTKSWNTEYSILGYAINYLRKRITRFAPIYYICLFLSARYHVFLYSTYTDKTALDVLNFQKGLWPELFFLNSIFFNPDSANSATWYISALLIGSLIIVLLLAISDRMGIQIWIPTIFVFSICICLYHINGSQIPIFRIIRALYGLAWGGICYIITTNIQKLELKGAWYISFNMFEIFFITEIIYFLFFYGGNIPLELPLTIFFGGLIIFSFEQKTIISHILNKKIFATMGTISYAIYVSHLQVLTKFGWLPGFDLLTNKFYSYSIIICTIILWGCFISFLPQILKYILHWLFGFVHAKDTIKYIRYEGIRQWKKE